MHGQSRNLEARRRSAPTEFVRLGLGQAGLGLGQAGLGRLGLRQAGLGVEFQARLADLGRELVPARLGVLHPSPGGAAYSE